MSLFDVSVTQPIPPSLECLIIDRLWGSRPLSEDNLNLSTFIAYYNAQSQAIGGHNRGRYTLIQNHGEIGEVATILRSAGCREEARKLISGFLKSGEQESLDHSIDLVARLLYMMKFGQNPHEVYGCQRPLEWTCGSLQDFVYAQVSRPRHNVAGRLRLEKAFNALNINRIGGIEIRWTDNLMDHLRMADDDSAVATFHHASYLQHQRYRYPNNSNHREQILMSILAVKCSPRGL